MTCRHVLDLIDAETLTDQSREQLDAVRQHAQQCATCGPALQAATTLTAGLVALPQLGPPPDLAAAVLARIARIDGEGDRAESASRAVKEQAATHDRPMWAGLAGVAAGVVLVLSTPLTESATTAIALPAVRGITGNLVAMPSTMAGVLALAAGLSLYAAGLFAPVSQFARRHGEKTEARG